MCGIPAKRSRDRLDNGLPIDVPGIPGNQDVRGRSLYPELDRFPYQNFLIPFVFLSRDSYDGGTAGQGAVLCEKEKSDGYTPLSENARCRTVGAARTYDYYADKSSRSIAVVEHSDCDRSIGSTLTAIRQLLGQYSPGDIALALFASSLWLPNIAAPMKHLVWAMVFASMKADEFTGARHISMHADFREFTEQLYPTLPQFSQMEDYIPECDWGDVRFHHEGSNYRIFYGCEIGNIYDWLMAFQAMYCSLDQEYYEHSKRSPVDELRQCLALQDHIIAYIGAQPSTDVLDLAPGHIELPSEEFWLNARAFCQEYHPQDRVSRTFLDLYSTSVGSIELPKPSVFCEAAYSGTVLPFFFIVCDGRYFPLLPRRYSPVLLDRWADVFSTFRGQLEHHGTHLMKLNAEVCAFLQKRINTGSLFRFASPVDAMVAVHGMW
jgi:hypothetical protein